MNFAGRVRQQTQRECECGPGHSEDAVLSSLRRIVRSDVEHPTMNVSNNADRGTVGVSQDSAKDLFFPLVPGLQL